MKQANNPAHPYQYYVSYMHSLGMGGTDISSERPITTPQDVAAIARMISISKQGGREVVLINWILLNSPNTP
jgi:hypothetical protein